MLHLNSLECLANIFGTVYFLSKATNLLVEWSTKRCPIWMVGPSLLTTSIKVISEYLKKQKTSSYFARTLARKSFFCKIAKKFEKSVFHPFSFFLLNAQFLCRKKFFFFLLLLFYNCTICLCTKMGNAIFKRTKH